MCASLDLDLLLLLDLDLDFLEEFLSLVKGTLWLCLGGAACRGGSIGGVGGFALTGVAMGAVVGVGVEGFGEIEVGEVPKGGGANVVGVGVGAGVRASFNDAMLFSKVAPKRRKTTCKPGTLLHLFVPWSICLKSSLRSSGEVSNTEVRLDDHQVSLKISRRQDKVEKEETIGENHHSTATPREMHI